MKKLFKITTIVLIQALLLLSVDFSYASASRMKVQGYDKSTLSPRLNISKKILRRMFTGKSVSIETEAFLFIKKLVNMRTVLLEHEFKRQQAELERMRKFDLPNGRISFQKRLVDDTKNLLTKIKELKEKLKTTADFKKVISILRQHSIKPTSDQKEVIRVLGRFLPGFNKIPILLGTPHSLLLKHLLPLGNLIEAALLIFASDENELLGIILVDASEHADENIIKFLSQLIHEYWHSRSKMLQTNSMNIFLNEGITTYLQNVTLKKILTKSKSRIVGLIGDQIENSKTNVLLPALFKDSIMDGFIEQTLAYPYEHIFIKILVGRHGEEFVKNIYFTGDLSPLKKQLGNRFNLMQEALELKDNWANAETKEYIVQITRREPNRFVIRMLADPSLKKESLDAFKTVMETAREIYANIRPVHHAHLSDGFIQHFLPEFYASDMIMKYTRLLLQHDITMKELSKGLLKDLYELIEETEITFKLLVEEELRREMENFLEEDFKEIADLLDLDDDFSAELSTIKNLNLINTSI